VRITGGKYLNRKIICPREDIRPAMDRMRESLFATLGDISELAFLDLFSGSGVVGIEAASRGAEPVVLVEKDSKKKKIIRRNMSFVESAIVLHTTSVEMYIKRCKDLFDIIYIDPPFSYHRKKGLLEAIAERSLPEEGFKGSFGGILAAGGRVIIHHPAEEYLLEKIKALTLYDRRKYGRSILSFYYV